MLKLRTDTKYAGTDGKLTQAGVEAIQGQFDALSSGSAVLDGRVTTLETTVAGSFIRLQTAVTASGTDVGFTGVPSWVRRATVSYAGLSTTGTSPVILQIGDGAYVTTGYLGTASVIGGGQSNFTNGCGIVQAPVAATVAHGVVSIVKNNGNQWVFSGVGAASNGAAALIYASSVTLANALDRVRITTSGGVDTFDAGSVNISWE